MITFVTGKPGDGKSLYGMSLIVKTLLHTDKVVATNIPVKVPELRAYLVLKGWKPKPGDDLAERLLLLSHDDVFEFYRHRSGGYVMPPSPDWVASTEGEDEDGKKIKKLTRFQFLKAMTVQIKEMKKHRRAHRSMEYHIDEAHDYFSAREWAATGRGILWYATKHRHLHDEIILYTQIMANVESQLRNLASYTVRARNQLRMRWGPFRKAPIFRLYHYHGGPEDTEKCVSFDDGVMHLDVNGLCRTYSTTGALSVHAKPEEVKNKAPLPYWALPVLGGVAVVLVVAVMALMPLMAGKYAGARIAKSGGETAKMLGVPVPAAAPVQTAAPGREVVQAAAVVVPDPVSPAAVVKAVMLVGTRVLVLVEGYEWATVSTDIGSGLYELGNGVIVRASDVRNFGAKKPSAKGGGGLTPQKPSEPRKVAQDGPAIVSQR